MRKTLWRAQNRSTLKSNDKTTGHGTSPRESPKQTRKNYSIKDMFSKQSAMKMKSINKNNNQKLYVKPQFQSTPLKLSCGRKEVVVVSDCESLVEDVTPIREERHHSRSYPGISRSGGHLGNDKLHKSACDLVGGASGSPISRKMLSLDETFFKELDLDHVEERDSGAFSENLCHVAESSTESHSPDIFSEKDTGSMGISNHVQALTSKRNEKHFKLPPLPIFKEPQKLNKSKVLQGPQINSTNCTKIVDDQLDGIDQIDWNNDSMLEHAMSKEIHSNFVPISQRIEKRPNELGEIRTVPLKKLKLNEGNGLSNDVNVILDNEDLNEHRASSVLHALCKKSDNLNSDNYHNPENRVQGKENWLEKSQTISSNNDTLNNTFTIIPLGNENSRSFGDRNCKSKRNFFFEEQNFVCGSVIQNDINDVSVNDIIICPTLQNNKNKCREESRNSAFSSLIRGRKQLSIVSNCHRISHTFTPNNADESNKWEVNGTVETRQQIPNYCCKASNFSVDDQQKLARSDDKSALLNLKNTNQQSISNQNELSERPENSNKITVSIDLNPIRSQHNISGKKFVECDVLENKPSKEQTTASESVASKATYLPSDHIQNAPSVIKKPNLTVREKNQRMLITNAQKPITNKLKYSDIVLSEVDPVPNNSFFDLGPYFGLPSKVKDMIMNHKGIKDLYEWQKECLDLPAVKQKINLVYALPTSGGKTLVAEILILRELLCYKKNALFVLPYVAIVQEKVTSLSPFAIDLGFLVEEYAAGKGCYPPKKRRHRQSIYIATIEKALSLINSLIEQKRMAELGLVIVDELHLLGETSGRGATLECLLTKLLYYPVLSEEKVHIVGMSATIGNLTEVAKFLQAEIYINSFRPVELKEYVKCENTLWAVNSQNRGTENLLTKMRVMELPYTAAMEKIDPDRVGGLVLEVVPERSCLIFCSTKKSCENVASMVIKIMPREMCTIRREERRALCEALKCQGRGFVCSVLQKCIPFGVAYHHSGLTNDERRLLEEAYRSGTLCCICCTSTLAAGVNLPAKRVIIRAPFVGRNFINLSQYKQMTGRAGRAGFDDEGESILICQQREMEQVNALLESEMDTAYSSLHTSTDRGLQSLVLSCIGLNIATTRSELHKVAACTLLNVQATKLGLSTNKLINEAVKNLFKLKALSFATFSSSCTSVNNCDTSNTSDSSINITLNTASSVRQEKSNKNFSLKRGAKLKISSLGKAAMKGPVDLCRANELYKDLTRAQGSLVLLSCLHLLFVVTPYDMMESIKPVPEIYFNAYNALDNKDLQTARVLGISEACVLRILKGQKTPNVPQSTTHRFYLTLILNDLWNNKSVWDVAEKYLVPRGTIQQLMVSSATFASCVMHFCAELQEFWAFKELLNNFVQRLSHCCTAELVDLMELPAVKTGRARQLYNAGYKTLKDVANADVNALVKNVHHLPTKIAIQIKSAAKLLLMAKAESLREEADEVMEGLINEDDNEKLCDS